MIKVTVSEPKTQESKLTFPKLMWNGVDEILLAIKENNSHGGFFVLKISGFGAGNGTLVNSFVLYPTHSNTFTDYNLPITLQNEIP